MHGEHEVNYLSNINMPSTVFCMTEELYNTLHQK